MDALLFPLRKLAIWLVWHGPYLGRFARPLFDFGMAQKGKRNG